MGEPPWRPIPAIKSGRSSRGCERWEGFHWWPSIRSRRTGRTGCVRASGSIRCLPGRRRGDAGLRKCLAGSRESRDYIGPSSVGGGGGGCGGKRKKKKKGGGRGGPEHERNPTGEPRSEKNSVFPHPLNSCPSQNPLEPEFFRSALQPCPSLLFRS